MTYTYIQGFWFAPEMELVMNSIEYSQKTVTGAVELKLYVYVE